jgi:hypothetical protein
MLMKGNLVIKEGGDGVREIEEKTLYPRDGQDRLKTRYLKIVCPASEKNDNLDIEIKTKLVEHHPIEGIFYKYKENDDAEKPEGDFTNLTEAGGETLSGNKKEIRAKGGKKPKKASCGFNFNWIREKVSTNKNRTMDGDFNLDLTYITNRVIACGFPAEGTEALFRNRKIDIVRFLKKNHGDMVKIYNLCAEQAYQYTAKSVSCSISRFPFFDHNIASLKKMFEFCLDAALFLQRMEQYHMLKREEDQANKEYQGVKSPRHSNHLNMKDGSAYKEPEEEEKKD